MKEPENNGRADRVNETRHTYRIMVFVNDLFDVYEHSTLIQLLASGYSLFYRKKSQFLQHFAQHCWSEFFSSPDQSDNVFSCCRQAGHHKLAANRNQSYNEESHKNKSLHAAPYKLNTGTA